MFFVLLVKIGLIVLLCHVPWVRRGEIRGRLPMTRMSCGLACVSMFKGIFPNKAITELMSHTVSHAYLRRPCQATRLDAVSTRPVIE